MPKVVKTILAKFKQGGRTVRNYTLGRAGKKVRYIVVHYTATLAPALNNLKYFSSRYVGASAHYFLDRNGDLYQSVLEKDTAWSVGASKYKHKVARNTNSINIEVVAQNNEFTASQKKTLNQLVAHLMDKYDVPQANVLRHYDVTGKTCPAWYAKVALRWTKLRTAITKPLKKAASTPAKAVKKPAVVKYYSKATAKTSSIVVALNSIKVGSSFANRKKIAAANGIKSYTGTAAQNTKLLKLVKAGVLKKP